MAELLTDFVIIATNRVYVHYHFYKISASIIIVLVGSIQLIIS